MHSGRKGISKIAFPTVQMMEHRPSGAPTTQKYLEKNGRERGCRLLCAFPLGIAQVDGTWHALLSPLLILIRAGQCRCGSSIFCPEQRGIVNVWVELHQEVALGDDVGAGATGDEESGNEGNGEDKLAHGKSCWATIYGRRPRDATE